MALDKEYFDAINIDIVKKKYYNANKVNALPVSYTHLRAHET